MTITMSICAIPLSQLQWNMIWELHYHYGTHPHTNNGSQSKAECVRLGFDENIVVNY